MGVLLIFMVLGWLACTAATLVIAVLIDRFATQRRWGRTARALWSALLAGHAVNLLLFWNPFTPDPYQWLLYGGALALAALLLLPFARRRSRGAKIDSDPPAP